MKYSFSFLMFLYSCSAINKPVNEPCIQTTAHLENSKNDTSVLILKEAMVFDTTATLIEGQVLDNKSYEPIENASMILKGDSDFIRDTTNSKGEFKIFRNLLHPNYNLEISKNNYACLLISHVIQTGGQIYIFKLKRK